MVAENEPPRTAGDLFSRVTRLRRTLLKDKQIRLLLEQLCVQLGFCLPPAEIERLVADPPSDAKALTDAVLRAEGMGPQGESRRLYQQIRDTVAAAFSRDP